VLITVLLILHGLAAVILIGATTHQTIASWKTKSAPSTTFFQSLINTRGATYTNAIVILYILTAIGGGIIYPTYVMDVKGTLTDAQMLSAIGAFEIKEHYAIIGLAMLPTYWYLWKKVPPAEHRVTRALNTSVICAMVWTSFLVGHVLNNIKGLI
jgi:hypothetical protein